MFIRTPFLVKFCYGKKEKEKSEKRLGLETKNPPMFIEGFLERLVVLLSCDSGETRTHGQWLKRPLSSRPKNLFWQGIARELGINIMQKSKVVSKYIFPI